MRPRYRFCWKSPVLALTALGDDYTPSQDFNLEELFENFQQLSLMQQMVIVSGVKRLLSDAVATSWQASNDIFINAAIERWNALLKGVAK